MKLHDATRMTARILARRSAGEHASELPRQADADHAIAADERGQLLLVHLLGARRAASASTR